MTPASLVEVTRAAGDPVAIAVALSAQARGDVEGLARLLAERTFAPRHRAIVLLAIGLALVDAADPRVPDAALDAVEEPAVVAAAIETGLAGALTGVLSFAPRDTALQATRKLIGRRLLAADVTGAHVARLLRDAGDDERAAEAAAFALATSAGEQRAAWLHVLSRWASDRDFLAAVLRGLRADLLRDLLRELDQVAGIAGPPRAALRSAVVWALSAGSQK